MRTALAVMAFGFLVEKFDLFLEIAATSLTKHKFSTGGQLVGDIAGLSLILLGGVMMIVAAIRFRQIRLSIESADARQAGGGKTDLFLVGLLILLGGTLFAYLLYTVIASLL